MRHEACDTCRGYPMALDELDQCRGAFYGLACLVGRQDDDIAIRGEHLFSLMMAVIGQMDQAMKVLTLEMQQRKAA